MRAIPPQDSLAQRLPQADTNQPQEWGAPISYQPRLGAIRDQDTHTPHIFYLCYQKYLIYDSNQKDFKNYLLLVVVVVVAYLQELFFLFSLSKK